jgi:membrane-associated phospholipid phosphatase
VALNQFVRSLRLHPRPFVFNDQAPMKDRLKGEAAGSFYSGHATAAFLSAVYLSYTYPMHHPDFQGRAWLWTGSLAAAAGVSSLRVLSGKHYLSDVVAGAAMGALFGFAVPWVHVRHNQSGAAQSDAPLIRVCGVGWDIANGIPTIQVVF